MFSPVHDNDGGVIGWTQDSLWYPATGTLTDAVYFLPSKPEVKDGIGTEIVLIHVDRTSDEFLDTLAHVRSYGVVTYDPKDPDDDFANLVSALEQQDKTSEFIAELFPYKRRWNLTTLGFVDFEKVAAKVLRFVCPVCTCRKVGTGEDFKIQVSGNGWLLARCTCGYTAYSRTLPELSFMPGSHPIGLPDEIALTQSAVLRNVLTVDDAKIVRIQARKDRERREEKEVLRNFESRVDAVCDVIAIHEYPSLTPEDAEAAVKVLKEPLDHEESLRKVRSWQFLDRQDYKKEIRPLIRDLMRSERVPELATQFRVELAVVQKIMDDPDLPEIERTAEYVAYLDIRDTLLPILRRPPRKGVV